ncbi:hypothetical protein EXS62_01780, partial [Candidatus Kaiserbacteria bacterium]|nr:hypothetical protein [Candidatus Kaiserbacteria bacterium]
MYRIETSFDVKGFAFALGVVGLFVAGGALWHFGFSAGPSTATTAVVVRSPDPAATAAPLFAAASERVIKKLTIADVVPASGTFIAADLVAMKLNVYQDGIAIAEY